MPRKRAAKPPPPPPAEPSPPPFVYEHHEQGQRETPAPASVLEPVVCASLADFSASLGSALEANDQAFIPEPCHQIFRFQPTATFLVDLSHVPSLATTLPQKVPVGSDPIGTNGANGRRKREEKAQYLLSAAGAMNVAEGDTDRSAKQRAMARAIVDAVQDVDGYRYGRWYFRALKEEKGWHGVFTCRDSVQNKDRAANAKNSLEKEDEENDAEEEAPKKKEGKGRLPTYNCEGAVTIRFSSKSKVLEVTYRHLMLHRETAWRPRASAPLTEEEAEARKQKKRQRRRDERKTETEKRIREKLERGEDPRSRKRKAGVMANTNGNGNGSDATSRQVGDSADGNNLDMLARLLRADIDNMNQQTATVDTNQSRGSITGQNGTLPAIRGHAVLEAPSDDGQSKKPKERRGGCLICRKRKVRCDRTKPRCEACIKSSRECIWPEMAPGEEANTSEAASRVVEVMKTASKARACLKCRNGKVKCDQSRPSCLACRLKRHECVYEDPDPGTTTTPCGSEVPNQTGVQSLSKLRSQSFLRSSPSSSQGKVDVGIAGEPKPMQSQDGESMGLQIPQHLNSQIFGSALSEVRTTHDVKPKKKRRKKSPPIRLALSPSPSPERAPVSALGRGSGLSRTAATSRPVQEEHIVFEPEDA